MAKLRGTHKTTEEVKKDLTSIYDEMFPNDAPPHLVIMGEEEYKRYNEELRESNYLT